MTADLPSSQEEGCGKTLDSIYESKSYLTETNSEQHIGIDEVMTRQWDNNAHMIMSSLKCQKMNNKTNKQMKCVYTQKF